ncbi:ImmA/IrrE family metallo-endopeptidase [Streptomyces sp. NBC_01485]|uniref:helix-turn-helix domain-containing protein n=1 Tax=Streptomyces sp. NBC_01485 TaxID=2903884 RepID=UPI002E3357B5|nr:ImmA/IrrE family metallo-endopeptidase [Streptomyces sp. NBC_01485]
MNYRHRSPVQVGDVAQLFDGKRLRLARHLAGLRKNGLADKVDKTPTAIASYEKNTKRPAPATVAQLSLALGVDPAFFLPGPVELEFSDVVAHFRSLRSTTQLARDQALAYGLATVEVSATLERHVEFPAASVPNFEVKSDDDSPEEAANSLRSAWEMPLGPISHLVRSAENRGVLVVFSPPASASVDAYSFEGMSRPVVVLNPTKRDYYRQRFDLAHELGHLVMHSDAEPGSAKIEAQADRFAAEFLMPGEQISELLPSKADWGKLQRLKESWGVSLQALLYRSRALGEMSEVTHRNAMMFLSSKGWRRQEPGVMPVLEQPSLLPGSVSLLESSGVTAWELAEESRVPLDLFQKICSRSPLYVAEEGIEAEKEALPNGVVSIFSNRH